jgi:hypothetical protein
MKAPVSEHLSPGGADALDQRGTSLPGDRELSLQRPV